MYQHVVQLVRMKMHNKYKDYFYIYQLLTVLIKKV